MEKLCSLQLNALRPLERPEDNRPTARRDMPQDTGFLSWKLGCLWSLHNDTRAIPCYLGNTLRTPLHTRVFLCNSGHKSVFGKSLRYRHLPKTSRDAKKSQTCTGYRLQWNQLINFSCQHNIYYC